MANYIDSLLIRLGLDVAGVTEGQKKAKDSLKKTGEEAVKTQKELDESAKKTAESYKKVRDGILGITAAIVGAVAGKEFLAHITATDIAVGRLSKNLGMATEELSAWEGVARRLGGNGSDADGLFRSINKILQDIKLTGGSEALTPLARAGLDIAKFSDQSTTMTQRALMLRDALKKLTPQDAQSFGQMAGMSEESLNILVQTDRVLERQLETQRKMNVESDEDKKLAIERNEAWANLTETMTGFGRKVANEITPALVGMLKAAQAALGYLTSDGKTATAVMAGLASAVALLTGYKLSLWAASTTGAFSAVAGAASTLLGRLGAIGASMAALYEIYHLADAAKQLWDIKHRQGVTLTPEAQARLAAGELNGVPDPFHSRGTGGGANPYASLEAAQGLPPGIMAALAKEENRQRPDGSWPVSPKGAMGPFQFMPATWAQYGQGDPNDPAAASVAAAKYLGYLYRMHGGSLSATLASYNEGEGNYAKGYMPPETQKYVADIMSRLNSQGYGMGSGGTTVNTGDIHVHSKSADPRAVANEVPLALRNFSLAAQANRGVS